MMTFLDALTIKHMQYNDGKKTWRVSKDSVYNIVFQCNAPLVTLEFEMFPLLTQANKYLWNYKYTFLSYCPKMCNLNSNAFVFS